MNASEKQIVALLVIFSLLYGSVATYLLQHIPVFYETQTNSTRIAFMLGGAGVMCI
jgi:hypothetical protein